ncbi:hypothetical protein ACFWU3_05940 [Streptomyces sp. NPDC058685]|uniref:hypothetical protein n=1 Tax=Streptomyces sp. NPDC058685 TaxID=3346598 RepID=UPI00364666DD
MVTTVDNRCWAVLLNARDCPNPARLDEMRGVLDALMWQLGNLTTDWPILSAFRDE